MKFNINNSILLIKNVIKNLEFIYLRFIIIKLPIIIKWQQKTKRVFI